MGGPAARAPGFFPQRKRRLTSHVSGGLIDRLEFLPSAITVAD